MEVTSRSGRNPRVVRLPDELVAEILARMPYRSLCRFNLVSRSWRALCSDPAVRRRCPQTLAGFFFTTTPLCGPHRRVRHFVNASGRGAPMVSDPSLAFLPPGHRDACFVDSCNGIFLCRREDDDTRSVFALVKAQNPFDLRDLVTGMEIYSSETGAWTYRPSEWGNGTVASCDSVFCNGTLHLISHGSASLLTVDIEGRTWGKIPTPRDFDFIGVSQGHLYAVHKSDRGNDDKLSIWVLEDYAGQQWIKKHAVSARQMFGTRPRSFGDSYSFEVQAIHPEHSLIFLAAGKLSSLMSYDMDKKRVRFIWTLGENNEPAYPYVPCFSDWLLPGQH
ncbi:unnamed protein product [Urochloa decumbens]|uniref:F-box domain-containing protein n=1 Tax=Urochloa decumbens TaxID=240449 RepID=A0ABC9GK04_9POAL